MSTTRRAFQLAREGTQIVEIIKPKETRSSEKGEHWCRNCDEYSICLSIEEGQRQVAQRLRAMRTHEARCLKKECVSARKE